MQDVITTVVTGLLSGLLSFIGCGCWLIIQTQKKQGKDLNIAFSKLRALEESYVSDSYQTDEYNAAEADDRYVCKQAGCPLPTSAGE